MRKTMDKVERLWAKNGFKVDKMEARGEGDTVNELSLHIRHADDRLFNFHDDWDNLKDLADKHRFYILPFSESSTDNPNQAEVLLVSKALLYGKLNEVNTLLKPFRNNYWYIQEDEAFRKKMLALMKCVNKATHIQTKVKKLESTQDGTVKGLTTQDLVKEWIEFKREVLCVTQDLINAGKCTEEEKDALKGYLKQYGY